MRFADIPKFTSSGNYEVDCQFPYALSFVDEMVASNGLQLDPDFQRAHVWTEQQQIAWLEFVYRGGKTGRVLYINCPDWNLRSKRGYRECVLVDGKQRLTAVRRFLQNEIPVFGHVYEEYEDARSPGNPTLKINVNDLKTRAAVLQWYIEMNAGGTPHTDAEIEKVRRLLDAER